MKTTLHKLLFLFLIVFSSNLHGQKKLNLKRYEHLSIKNCLVQFQRPQLFINKEGWVFVQEGGIKGDSFAIQDFNYGNMEDYTTLIFAFDNNGKMRWNLTLPGKKYITGGMIIYATGPDNSVFIMFGSRDSVKLPGNDPIYYTDPIHNGGTHKAIIDSLGNIKNIKLINTGIERNGGITYNAYNDKIIDFTSYGQVYMLNANNELINAGPLSKSKSAVMDDKGNSYYCFVSFHDIQILDTTIKEENPNITKWILTKINSKNEREWTHVIANDTWAELQDNKLLRCDKFGNVFWVVNYQAPFSILGHDIPFYTQGNITPMVQKSCVLRFSPDGQLLSTHVDTTSVLPFVDNRHVIWLENDIDMNIYAYFFSSGRTYSFDGIDFGEDYSYINRYIIFDHNANKFNKYYYLPDNKGNVNPSSSSVHAHKQIFWYRFFGPDIIFTDGSVVRIRYDNYKTEGVITVYDTSTSKHNSITPITYKANQPVTIYPNPSSDNYRIINNQNQSIVCSIFSIDMKLIDNFELKEMMKYEFGNTLTPGIYFIRISDSSGLFYTEKIIKQ